MDRTLIYYLIILLIPFKIFASGFDNSYLSPKDSLYAPQPYEYENNKLIFIEVVTEADTLRALVPDPLVPNNENKLQIYIGDLTLVRPNRLNYREAGVVIPVSYRDEENNRTHYGNYFSVLYLDDVDAIVGGKDVYGFPKVLADIDFARTEKQVTGQVSIEGKVLIDIKFDIEQKVENIQQSDETWVAYTYKRVPDANLKNEYVVRQIISTPINGFKTHELYYGNAVLNLSSTDYNPLGSIPVKSMSYSIFKVDDNAIQAGEVLHDYLQ